MRRMRERALALLLCAGVAAAMLPGAALADGGRGFTDVPPTAWYHNDVDYAAQRGYLRGVADGVFAPEAVLTRAMLVVALARVDGAETADAVPPFSDIPPGAWCAGAVAWAADRGLVSGVGGGRFDPDGAATREQLCTVLAAFLRCRAAEDRVHFPSAAVPADFSDGGEVSPSAAGAVELCRGYALVRGDGTGRFAPQAALTRAAAAAVLRRLDGLLADAAPVPEAGPPPSPVARADGGDSSGGPGGTGSAGGTSSAGEGERTAVYTGVRDAADLVAKAGRGGRVRIELADAGVTLSAADALDIATPAVELTLDLKGAAAGDVTITAPNAERLVLEGAGASFHTLTVDVPKAHVENHVDVGGVELRAVSGSTFESYSAVLRFLLTGPGTLDVRRAEAPPAVTVATAQAVALKGAVGGVTVTADDARLALSALTGPAPTVTGLASGMALALDTEHRVVLAGDVASVTAGGSGADIVLAGARVGTLTAAPITSVAGVGGVETVVAANAADGALTLNVPVEAVEIPAGAGGTVLASDRTLPSVAAWAPVRLEASVGTLTAPAGAALYVARGRRVDAVEVGGSLTLTGAGAVGQVDVTGGDGATVTSAGTPVAAINSLGDGPVDRVGAAVRDLLVERRAPKPAGVVFRQPTRASGQGAILGLDGASMEYRSDAGTEWSPAAGPALAVEAGHTYFVRTAGRAGLSASRPVAGRIDAAVAVSAVTVAGRAVVGEFLTASADAGATGALTYEWRADGVLIGGGRSLRITDALVGGTVTAAVSNYGGAGAASAPTAPVTADKSGLTDLTAQAEGLRAGVTAVPDDVGPEAVALGVRFVSVSQAGALSAAIAAARARTGESLTTDGARAAATALQAAVTDYGGAVRTGVLDRADALRSALEELLAEGRALAAGAISETSALNVAPGAVWAPPEVLSGYAAALSDAEGKKDGGGALLAGAVAGLNAAMADLRSALRRGAALDRGALAGAVAAARADAASVAVAADGAAVPPDMRWVTEEAGRTYAQAIGRADGTTGPTQRDLNGAVAALSAATAVFEGEKRPGERDVTAPAVTLDGVGWTSLKKAEARFRSDEDGTYTCEVDGTETGGGAVTAGQAAAVKLTGLTAGSHTLTLRVTDGAGNATRMRVVLAVNLDAVLNRALAAVNDNQSFAYLKDPDGEGNIDVEIYLRATGAAEVCAGLVAPLLDTFDRTGGLADVSAGGMTVALGGQTELGGALAGDFARAGGLLGAGGGPFGDGDVLWDLLDQRLSVTVRTAAGAELDFSLRFIYPDLDAAAANEILQLGLEAVEAQPGFHYAHLSELDPAPGGVGGTVDVTVSDGGVGAATALGDLLLPLASTLQEYSIYFLGLTVGSAPYYELPQTDPVTLDVDGLTAACGLMDGGAPADGGTPLSRLDGQRLTVALRGANGAVYPYTLRFVLAGETGDP